jgi:hypothetical protein
MQKKKQKKFTKEEEARIVSKLPLMWCVDGKITKNKINKFIEILRRYGEL